MIFLLSSYILDKMAENIEVESTVWAERVYKVLDAKHPDNERLKELGELSKKTYITNIRSFMRLLKVTTIAELAKLPKETIEKAIGTIKVRTTASAKINAYVSVLNRFINLPKIAEYDKVRIINTKIAKENQEKMAENIKENFQKDKEFDKKIDAYLKENEGTRYSLLVAMFAKAPPIRPHVLENCRIARTNAEFMKMKKENNTSVFLIDPSQDKYLLHVPAKLNKVKTLDFYSEYTEKAVQRQLNAYLKENKGIKLLFGTVKGATILGWIMNAFEETTVGRKGAQYLRRVFSSTTANNPMLTAAERQDFARRMNHSESMDIMYGVKKYVKRGKKADDIVKDGFGGGIGKLVEALAHMKSPKILGTLLLEFEAFVAKVQKSPV